MKFNVVPRREIRIWKMSSPRTAWCKSRFTSIVDDYHTDNGDDKTIVNLQVHRQNTQHRRWYGRERTQRCKGLNVHDNLPVQNMWFFFLKIHIVSAHVLQHDSSWRGQKRRRKSWKEKLVAQNWSIYLGMCITKRWHLCSKVFAFPGSGKWLKKV